jgi:hypothetical protein
MGLHGLLWGYFYFLYVDDVRISQKTHLLACTVYLLACTVCYGDNLTFLYIDDVRISQETHLWASTACYEDNFTFLYVDDVRTSQETHLLATTAVTGIASLLYMQMMFVHYRKYTYGPPRSVTGIALSLQCTFRLLFVTIFPSVCYSGITNGSEMLVLSRAHL